MTASEIPSVTPLVEHQGRRPLRQRIREGDSYGLVLILIIACIATEATSGGGRLWHVAEILLLAATLLAALRTSMVSARTVRIFRFVVLPLTVASVLFILFGADDAAVSVARLFAALLAIVAPVVIIARIARHPQVTVETVLGAVCIYLLLGLFFAQVYGAIATLQSAAFFAQTATPSAADFVYFSYVTQTTVGYGDLSATGDVGRMFAITEALIGQIYLVTVVAVLVSNIGATRKPPTRVVLDEIKQHREEE